MAYVKKDELPDCPESYIRRTPCRAAKMQPFGWGCTALLDTDFKSGRCPFYKTEKQFQRDEEK